MPVELCPPSCTRTASFKPSSGRNQRFLCDSINTGLRCNYCMLLQNSPSSIGCQPYRAKSCWPVPQVYSGTTHKDSRIPHQHLFHVKSQGFTEDVSEMISRGQYQLEAISAATFIAARCVGAGMLALGSPLLTLIDVLALEPIALPACRQNLPLATPCNHPADNCLLS